MLSQKPSGPEYGRIFHERVAARMNARRQTREASARQPLDLALQTGLAFAITGAPILLHQIGQPLAVAFCLAASCAVGLFCERAAPIVLFVAFLFQSTFIAMASPYATQYSDLDALKAYDFVTTAGLWATIMARLAVGRDRPSWFVRRMIVVTAAGLALAGVYFVLGLPIDSRGAAIYLRNIGLPILLFQICLLVASRRELPMRGIAALLLGMLVVCGYFELIAPRLWLDLTNGWTYWDLASAAQRQSVEFERDARASGAVVGDTLDLFATKLFNTDLLDDLHLSVVRLQGPNFHPISFGYALAILSAFVAVHGRFALPLAAAPLLLAIGAKGALALLALSLAYCLAGRFVRGVAPPAGLAIALFGYAAFVFLTGLRSGDFHVLGLIGGINGFLSEPAGHTLGAGGNLSTDIASFDWSWYQRQGSTDVAVESAAGVLLYQMGVAGIVVIAIYLWLARVAWRLSERLHAPSLTLATASIAIILVNGLFQEEAWFAPLALGLALALAGLTFGAVDRLVAPHGREKAGGAGDAPPLARTT